jgi:hypothetical protein
MADLTSSRTRFLLFVAPSLLALMVLGGIFLRSGYRAVAEPVGADFAFVVAEPGGVRLFFVQPHTSQRSAWGWHPCGGRFTADLDRSGDKLLLDLAYHPSPGLGGCAASGSGDVQAEEGVFVRVEGSPPVTVLVPGGSVEHRVLDPLNGPGIGGPEWEQHVTFMSFQTPTTPDRIRTWWDPPDHDLWVTLTHPAVPVGADQESWLRAGDLGPDPPHWDEALPSGDDSHLRLAGLDLRASFHRGGETTYVALTAEDGRRVLEMDVSGASVAEVRRLVQSLRL